MRLQAAQVAFVIDFSHSRFVGRTQELIFPLQIGLEVQVFFGFLLQLLQLSSTPARTSFPIWPDARGWCGRKAFP